ncbi:FAD-binding oxidoreductase [Phytoactinopolyspora limicola]|uniref:FAD-binding oxidoreductase n=1 Tax=Phytoactinopolyspora limicola TaxID=2715536 RepID=UPI001409032E|nr:FAD-binding oxidoreductase [Phytoactinopolyspora limicola]
MTIRSVTPPAIGDVVRQLHGSFAGDVHLPGQPGYDAERASWHRTADPWPAIIAVATNERDVQAAVRAAATHGMPLTVQATGHGTYPGDDNGILLKTSRLDSVMVDPASRTARVGPGTRWSAVVDAAAPYGLAPLSGTSSIGATGYLLGGGAGYLSRTFGLAADSLVRADVVTSSGQRLTVSGDEHPDLFWALRGGGGNFAVATSIEFVLFPVEKVYAGISFHDASRTQDVLRRYRDWVTTAIPDEVNTAVILATMPEAAQVPEPIRGRAVLGIRAVCATTAANAEQHLAPLLDAAGPALAGGFAEQTYAAASAQLSGHPQPPTAVAQRFELLHTLPDDVIEPLAAAAAGPIVVEVRHWGGAIARPGPNAGAAGHRDVPLSVLAAAMAGTRDELAHATPALDRLIEQVRPWATGGSFLNFLADTGRTAAAYTPDNYRRLAEVKRVWDPNNLFRGGHNILPAADADSI